LIHFVWRGEIVGNADGTIQFTFDGEAGSTFLKNRIGFCVLHPIRECAGAPCRVEHADGSTARSSFPKLVAAEQPMKDLHDLRALAHEIAPGVWAEVRFEGEAFEMEDQRNWIDASYKTFCTPLRLPFPVEIKAGTKVRQGVTLRLVAMPDARCPMPDFKTPRATENRAADIVNLEIGSVAAPLPSLGLSCSSNREPANLPNKKRFAVLGLCHLRTDVHLLDPEWRHDLLLSRQEANVLNLAMEVAIHVSGRQESDFAELAELLGEPPTRLSRCLVFDPEGKPASPELLRLMREHLSGLGIPIGGGTNADFYQLNQSRPTAEWCDFICWSMNPQVHAFDNASLAETPSAIPAQVESAREYFPGKPLIVSPVTLKPRFNPVATGKQSGPVSGELPPQVDPRQMSLFGAGWTLGAIKHLAESGVDSVTLYETTGWRGVMETEAGSPLPDKFPSIAGAVFPLYHVLADVGEFAGGEVVVCNSSDPVAVEGMVLRKAGRMAVLLANLTDQPQVARVTGLQPLLRARLLDEANVIAAMTEPRKFRANPGGSAEIIAGTLEVELRPYGLARLA